MTLKLPQPIAAYFLADRRDPQAVAQCFTQDAIVKDEGHVYRGQDAIESWKKETSAKYQYYCEPLSSVQQAATTIVTACLTGNFPGSPLNLRFLFQLEGNKISSLEIIP
jgi:hypothetical protein